MKSATGITSIGLDNFDSEVLLANRPVLLAVIHKDHTLRDQLNILENVSNTYRKILKVCLLDFDNLGVFMDKYGIDGTPTYLIFHGGNEKDGMLGKVNSTSLQSFIERNILHISIGS